MSRTENKEPAELEILRRREEVSLDWAKVDEWSNSLDSDGGFKVFAAARDALARYGGLSIRAHGPGHDRARSSFDIDPMLALGEEDRFKRVGLAVGARLYPLGEVDNGHAFLGIDEAGRVFIVDDDAMLVALSIDKALLSLLQGCTCHK